MLTAYQVIMWLVYITSSNCVNQQEIFHCYSKFCLLNSAGPDYDHSKVAIPFTAVGLLCESLSMPKGILPPYFSLWNLYLKLHNKIVSFWIRTDFFSLSWFYQPRKGALGIFLLKEKE